MELNNATIDGIGVKVQAKLYSNVSQLDWTLARGKQYYQGGLCMLVFFDMVFAYIPMSYRTHLQCVSQNKLKLQFLEYSKNGPKMVHY